MPCYHQAERVHGVGKGNGSGENVLNYAVHSFPVKHRAYRISIRPDNAVSDKGLVKRCSVYVDWNSRCCSRVFSSVLEKSTGC